MHHFGQLGLAIMIAPYYEFYVGPELQHHTKQPFNPQNNWEEVEICHIGGCQITGLGSYFKWGRGGSE